MREGCASGDSSCSIKANLVHVGVPGQELTRTASTAPESRPRTRYAGRLTSDPVVLYTVWSTTDL